MKILQFNTLSQIVSKNNLSPLHNQQRPKTKSFELGKFLRSEFLKQENIEVAYKIKGKSAIKFEYIFKNPKNFGGGSVGLPCMCNKVVMSAKISSGFYTNTWVALQNRTTYKPVLLVNGVKYNPVEVNGCYLKYQFHAQKLDKNTKPENQITIKVGLNPFAYSSPIVGIWFE